MKRREFTFLANQYGGAEEIRAHLNWLRPKDEADIAEAIDYLEQSLEVERETKNRRTVIGLLQLKLYRLRLQINNQ